MILQRCSLLAPNSCKWNTKRLRVESCQPKLPWKAGLNAEGACVSRAPCSRYLSFNFVNRAAISAPSELIETSPDGATPKAATPSALVCWTK